MASTVVVDAVRSPIGRARKGSLVDVRPDDLAAGVVTELLARHPELSADLVDDVICGVAAGVGEQGYNLGRIVGQLAGLPDTVPGTSVNRFCASSLQAIRMAHHAIRAGEGDIFVVVGVESVSRRGPSFGEADRNPRLSDATRPDFVNDMYIDMVATAERVATAHDVSRADMDAFAVESHRRALEARERGHTAREIAPVSVGSTVVEHDDGPRAGTTVEKLAALAPVTGPQGRVTAGNACPLNDGAAAALVVSEKRARELGLRSRARILGTHVTGLAPEVMGLGPIEASAVLMKRLRMTVGDVDVVELNEAFAAQVLPVCRELGVDLDTQLNPFGGAIALGHPFGMTGVRMLTTLLNALEVTDGEVGLQTLCIGGGQGMAMMIERTA